MTVSKEVLVETQCGAVEKAFGARSDQKVFVGMIGGSFHLLL